MPATEVDVAAVYKRRPKDAVNQVQALDVMGDVDGRMCVLIDDMIDTAGTICAAADILLDRGRDRGVGHGAPTPVLSDPATDRLKNSRHRPGRGHRHPAPAPGEADRQDRGGVGGAKIFADCHRRRVRRRVGLPDLRRRKPDLIVAVSGAALARARR